MKLMSHNSWSFLTPKTFLGRCFNFMALCQDKNIQEQYEKYDVRYFDLRVKLDRNNKTTIAHGLFEYGNDTLKNDLEYLNLKQDTVYVRVFLEVRNKLEDTERQQNWFFRFCELLEKDYPNINFIGGNPTYDGIIRYYKFDSYHPTSDGKHASWATKCKLDDLWPRLYAKLHNKKSYEEGTDCEFLSLDFVEYGSNKE